MAKKLYGESEEFKRQAGQMRARIRGEKLQRRIERKKSDVRWKEAEAARGGKTLEGALSKENVSRAAKKLIERMEKKIGGGGGGGRIRDPLDPTGRKIGRAHV